MLRFIAQHDFTRLYGDRHAAVFSGRHADEGPFATSTWPMCLLGGGLSLEQRDFQALSGVALRLGDAEATLVDPKWSFPDSSATTLLWELAYFEDARLTSLGHLEVHVFGASQQWGLTAHWEGFSVFGAEPKVFAEFLNLAGGLSAVGERYSAWESGVGFGEQGQRYRSKLRGMVAWQA